MISLIIGNHGYLGGGKTVNCVYILKKFKDRGYDLMTNFKNNLTDNHIQFYDYDKLPNLKDVVLGIDEIEMDLDSRGSMSKRQRYLTYLLFQTRKRKVHLVYTAPQRKLNDLRLRDNTNIVIKCSKHHQDNHSKCINSECKELHFFRYFCIDMENRKTYSYEIWNPQPIFDLFDTYELLEPNEDLKPVKKEPKPKIELKNKNEIDDYLRLKKEEKSFGKTEWSTIPEDI